MMFTIAVLAVLALVWVLAWRIFVSRAGGTEVLNALLPMLIIAAIIVIVFGGVW